MAQCMAEGKNQIQTVVKIHLRSEKYFRCLEDKNGGISEIPRRLDPTIKPFPPIEYAPNLPRLVSIRVHQVCAMCRILLAMKQYKATCLLRLHSTTAKTVTWFVVLTGQSIC